MGWELEHSQLLSEAWSKLIRWSRPEGLLQGELMDQYNKYTQISLDGKNQINKKSCTVNRKTTGEVMRHGIGHGNGYHTQCMQWIAISLSMS